MNTLADKIKELFNSKESSMLDSTSTAATLGGGMFGGIGGVYLGDKYGARIGGDIARRRMRAAAHGHSRLTRADERGREMLEVFRRNARPHIKNLIATTHGANIATGSIPETAAIQDLHEVIINNARAHAPEVLSSQILHNPGTHVERGALNAWQNQRNLRRALRNFDAVGIRKSDIGKSDELLRIGDRGVQQRTAHTATLSPDIQAAQPPKLPTEKLTARANARAGRIIRDRYARGARIFAGREGTLRGSRYGKLGGGVAGVLLGAGAAYALSNPHTRQAIAKLVD